MQPQPELKIGRSGNGCRIKQDERIFKLPVLCPSFFTTTGHLQHEVKKFPAHFFDFFVHLRWFRRSNP